MAQQPRTGAPESDPGNPETHILLPLRVRPGRAAGEATVTIRSAEGFLQPPEAAFTAEGHSKATPLRLTTADGGRVYEGVMRGLPAACTGTITVRGKTRSGKLASAIEPFVMVRAETPERVSVYGPRGHVAIHLPAQAAPTPRRDVCIGPGGLDKTAPPDGMVVVGLPYFVCATGGMNFPAVTPMEARLPADQHGLLDRRVNPQSLRLFIWSEQSSAWHDLPSVLMPTPWTMLTARIQAAGTYAVFGRLLA
jgi:hypothetical protein